MATNGRDRRERDESGEQTSAKGDCKIQERQLLLALKNCGSACKPRAIGAFEPSA